MSESLRKELTEKKEKKKRKEKTEKCKFKPFEENEKKFDRMVLHLNV
jgi:hypothetical protein